MIDARLELLGRGVLIGRMKQLLVFQQRFEFKSLVFSQRRGIGLRVISECCLRRHERLTLQPTDVGRSVRHHDPVANRQQLFVHSLDVAGTLIGHEIRCIVPDVPVRRPHQLLDVAQTRGALRRDLGRQRRQR